MISVIIVNYNRKDLLRQCLDSLRSQSFKDIEIIVVDNASKDGSLDMLKDVYPEVKLIQNTDNLLFCRAQNQGVEASTGDFILCLNNDVILDRDYLKEMVFSAGLEDRIGMISGKILRTGGKVIDSTGLFLGRNRKAVERGYGEIDNGRYDKPEFVFGVSGSCAFLRKGMLLDLKDENGYFDERFGMYYEDLDLCWRAQKKAWKAYYNPNALAYHMRGGTAAGSNRKTWPVFHYIGRDLKKRYIVNRYRCIRKNDSFLGFLINLPFILFYEIKMYGYLALYLAFGFARTIFFERAKRAEKKKNLLDRNPYA
ncbi:MAG: glycosyltransferase family 2 protein [Candidatus Omnitrophota bacterium]|nr:glycosyltransferase family 2 protein [Candidatus Omnitrophota bacterium]